MAKINGIALKNVKTFLGMEGYGMQGNVYIDNKKVGFYSDDGNGGEGRLSFDTQDGEKLYTERKTAYYTKYPPAVSHITRYDGVAITVTHDDDDNFFATLDQLRTYETAYKKGVKSYGHSALVAFEAPMVSGEPVPLDIQYTCDPSAIETVINQEKAKYPKWNVKVFRALDDFIIM